MSRLLVVPAERWEISSAPGCSLGKVMGTSRADTTRTSVDLRRWVLMAVWDSPDRRDDFLANSTLLTRWRNNAHELRYFALEPLASHGQWNGVDPFASVSQRRSEDDQPVAVLTRAKVRWSKLLRFVRAVPPPDDALRQHPGCSFALGMGEWPFGEQATFSLWQNADAIRRYAYEDAAHADVIRRRADEHWYSEEMFSRFAFTEHDAR